MSVIGLDYSTQQLKAVIIDKNSFSILEENITFDTDLSHYKCNHGVYINKEVIVAPPLMWIEATDRLFAKLKTNINLNDVTAISGSAQQHTTIFWKKGWREVLRKLDPKLSLKDQLKNYFSLSLSPTWMDSSTSKEKEMLENILGGKREYQEKMGSTLVERFSACQILKEFNANNKLAQETESVTLVSNGMASLFNADNETCIDKSDAIGVGLVKCDCSEWEPLLCQMISPDLQKKLGKIVSSNSIMGTLSSYFIQRYKMNPECKVISFTGDNPSSVVGMKLNKYEICISLGTSDTLFTCFSKQPKTINNVPLFIFPHPLSEEILVTLICYKNGSQVRDYVCQKYCNGNWNMFKKALHDSPPGNSGIIGAVYLFDEITPPISKGTFFAKIDGMTLTWIDEKDLDMKNIIRALVEGQLLTKYVHFIHTTPDKLENFSEVLVTGGASSNLEILQITADVFGMTVNTIDTVNSAALGAAFRAIAATENSVYYKEFLKNFGKITHTFKSVNHQVYEKLLPVFETFLEFITTK